MRKMVRSAMLAVLAGMHIAMVCGNCLAATAADEQPANGTRVRNVMGLSVALKSIARLPSGQIRVTYSIGGLGGLKKGAKAFLGKIDMHYNGAPVLPDLVILSWSRSGQSAKATVEADIPRNITALTIRQELRVEQGPSQHLHYTSEHVSPQSGPVIRKAGGHTVTLRKVYVNSYLLSGRPMLSYGKQGRGSDVDFLPGKSGHRNMGVLVETDYPESVLAKMTPSLRCEDGRFLTQGGYMVMLNKGSRSARIFLFKERWPAPKMLTFDLAYELPPDSKAAWVTFENVPIKPAP